MKIPEGYAPPRHWPMLGKHRASPKTHIWFCNGSWWAWTPPVNFHDEGALSGPYRTPRLGWGK